MTESFSTVHSNFRQFLVVRSEHPSATSLISFYNFDVATSLIKLLNMLEQVAVNLLKSYLPTMARTSCHIGLLYCQIFPRQLQYRHIEDCCPLSGIFAIVFLKHKLEQFELEKENV